MKFFLFARILGSTRLCKISQESSLLSNFGSLSKIRNAQFGHSHPLGVKQLHMECIEIRQLYMECIEIRQLYIECIGIRQLHIECTGVRLLHMECTMSYTTLDLETLMIPKLMIRVDRLITSDKKLMIIFRI